MIKVNFVIIQISLLAACSTLPCSAHAKWSSEAGFSTYFTDYVGLFSVTRRLSLEQDPTQPVVDEPEKNSDFIYEPNATLSWSSENDLGENQLTLAAGGYIFQNHTAYTHAFMQFEAKQAITEKTSIKLLYDFLPELFIGRRSASRDEEIAAEEVDERLDSHTWSIHLEHELLDQLLLRGLVRYGIRLYEQPFSYRDTQFFTVGSHIEWIISPDIELLAGYHFEHGYTEDSKTVQFQDDIGYINHYVSTELKISLNPRFDVMLIFDYEHNEYTTPYPNDIHFNGNENVFQGEIEIRYKLTETSALKSGWQYGSRKFNYEQNSAFSNNVWLGVEFEF